MAVATKTDLISSALDRMVNKLEASSKQAFMAPSEWLEKYFWIPEPRDPITGELFPPGPIILADHQKRIVDEALSKRPDGKFKYSTIIYSAPKKSGKSAISAGVCLYMAYSTPFGRIYCLANDGKQSDDRLFGPILECIKFHKDNNLLLKDVRVVPSTANAYLDNSARIEAINCDEAGESGSQPTFVAWSELWGFTTEKKARLWTELTIPSTKSGRALRWVESYAGFVGVSKILWDLYNQGVLEGTPHPDFEDLTSDGEAVVRINEGAGMLCYWDHDQRMIWQDSEFDQREARTIPPDQYQRIYHNRWVSSLGAYIQPEWWDACQDESIGPLLDNKTPVVVAIDAAETNDCAAIVAITRHPKHPETDVAVRACKIFRPVPGKSVVILEDTIGRTIQEWGRKWNIVCIAYDAFQMAKLVQDYRRGQVTLDQNDIKGMNDEEINTYIKEIQRAIQRWYFKFSQQTTRAVADKQLYDMIVNQQIHWNPNDRDSDITPRGNDETLTKHVKQAGVDQTKGQYRIKKLSNDLKIDATVALSMAVERCMALILENRENSDNTIEALYRDHLIDYSEYIARKARATIKNV